MIKMNIISLYNLNTLEIRNLKSKSEIKHNNLVKWQQCWILTTEVLKWTFFLHIVLMFSYVSWNPYKHIALL